MMDYSRLLLSCVWLSAAYQSRDAGYPSS